MSAAGMLADGRSASMSGTLQCDGDGAFVTLYASPSAYRKGWFVKTLRFKSTEAGVVVTAMPDLTDYGWVSKASGTSFERSVGVRGGWYSKLASVYSAYYASEFAADIAAVAGYDAIGLYRISFAKATGRFSGTVKAEYVQAEKSRSKSVACYGVVTPLTDEANAPAGSGFFLLDGESREIILED